METGRVRIEETDDLLGCGWDVWLPDGTVHHAETAVEALAYVKAQAQKLADEGRSTAWAVEWFWISSVGRSIVNVVTG